MANIQHLKLLDLADPKATKDTVNLLITLYNDIDTAVRTVAEEAVNTATEAVATANDATTTSNVALAQSDVAMSDAQNATNTATTALEVVSAVENDLNTAVTTAENAMIEAEKAVGVATAAVDVANNLEEIVANLKTIDAVVSLTGEEIAALTPTSYLSRQVIICTKTAASYNQGETFIYITDGTTYTLNVLNASVTRGNKNVWDAKLDQSDIIAGDGITINKADGSVQINAIATQKAITELKDPVNTYTTDNINEILTDTDPDNRRIYYVKKTKEGVTQTLDINVQPFEKFVFTKSMSSLTLPDYYTANSTFTATLKAESGSEHILSINLSPYRMLRQMKIDNTNIYYFSWRVNTDNANYGEISASDITGVAGDKFTITSININDGEDGSFYPYLDYIACATTEEGTIEEIALTNYVDQAIANLINGAPEDMNTLKELSDLMSTNSSAMEVLNAAIGAKANTVDVYTKTETDTKLNEKVNQTNFNTVATEVTTLRTDVDGLLENPSGGGGAITELEGTAENPIILWDLEYGYYLIRGFFRPTASATQNYAVGSLSTATPNDTAAHIRIGKASSTSNKMITIFGGSVSSWGHIQLGYNDVMYSDEFSSTTKTLDSSDENKLSFQTTLRNYSYGWSSTYGDKNRYTALAVNNEQSYTPTKDYNPATKIYVDNSPAIKEMADINAITGVSLKNHIVNAPDFNDKTLYFLKQISADTYDPLVIGTAYTELHINPDILSVLTASSITVNVRLYNEDETSSTSKTLYFTNTSIRSNSGYYYYQNSTWKSMVITPSNIQNTTSTTSYVKLKIDSINTTVQNYLGTLVSPASLEPVQLALYADLENAGGIKTLTSPVRIWDLEDGVYLLPENCSIQYMGATNTTTTFSLGSQTKGILKVQSAYNTTAQSTSTKVLNKYFEIDASNSYLVKTKIIGRVVADRGYYNKLMDGSLNTNITLSRQYMWYNPNDTMANNRNYRLVGTHEQFSGSDIRESQNCYIYNNELYSNNNKTLTKNNFVIEGTTLIINLD